MHVLQFKSYTVADVVVARFVVPGLAEGPELNDTYERLQLLIGPARGKSIIIDFSSVQFVASSALSVLITLKHLVESGGGALAVCGLRKQVSQVFRIMGLDRTLAVHTTQDEALAALGAVAN
jgi:anti-anti-sigma factor